MKLENLRDLFVAEMQDIYSAENQIVAALPKMAKAASSKQLHDAFESHLVETKGHVQRLEEAFKALGKDPKGKVCQGMKGLLKEGSEMMEEHGDAHVIDAGLISAAQRVEHYEMAAYGTVKNYATLLGENQIAALLEETLAEEKEADAKLTKIASTVNVSAKAA